MEFHSVVGETIMRVSTNGSTIRFIPRHRDEFGGVSGFGTEKGKRRMNSDKKAEYLHSSEK